MSKIFALAFLVLAFSSMIDARKAVKKCEVTFYGPAPEPVCETVIDENGEEQEECYAVGAPASRLILNKRKSSYQESTQLDEVNFEGTCDCSLKLYTKANFEGLSHSYPFSKSNNRVIMVNEIWSYPNNSFKLICKF